MFHRLNLKKRHLAKISTVIALSMALVFPSFPAYPIQGLGQFGTVAKAADVVPYSAKDIALNPGADESQLNITWYSPGQPQDSIVQIAKKTSDGPFPVDSATTFHGISLEAATVTDVTYYSNKVTVTGLETNTQYVYRVGDGNEENWSPAYDFSTQDPNNYTIMFVGDPQIGASRDVTKDTINWTRTLDKALTEFPDISFIMSAGDQIDTASNEAQYDGFLAPDKLRSYPVATTIGNHDTGAANYKYHFTVPNESDKGVTNAGGDYYYTYGDTLFMVLNSNSKEYEQHRQFLRDAINAVPDAKWRIVTFHHDIYGDGPHIKDAAVLELRAAIVPTLDELDIDLVLVGHDHTYARSLVMNDDEAQTEQLLDDQGRDVNPTGITYTTASSASGSKFYDLQGEGTRYIAKEIQNDKRMFTNIKVSPNSITLETYELERTDGRSEGDPANEGDSSPVTDQMTLVDSYTLVKQPENVKVYAKENQVDSTADSVDYYYAVNQANAVSQLETTFTYDDNNLKFTGVELVDPTLIEENSDQGFIQSEVKSPGTVEIKANLDHPVRSAAYDDQYTDVFKLTFQLKPGTAVAHLDLANSVHITKNKHRGQTSNVTEDKATVISGTPVDNVTIQTGNPRVQAGNKVTLIAEVLPIDAKNRTLAWTSSNPAIATVDNNGMVTGLSAGTVDITATTLDGTDLKSTVTVTVTSGGNSGGGNSGGGSGGGNSGGGGSSGGGNSSGGGSSNSGTNNGDVNNGDTDHGNTNDGSNHDGGTNNGGGTSNGGENNGGTAPIQFNDVPSDFWAAEAINNLVSWQILMGTAPGKFEPHRNVTRAEFVTMLVRALGLTDKGHPSFRDVKDSDWFADAVAIAAKAGIIQGDSAQQFNPKANITREEMVTMLMRAYEVTYGRPSVNAPSGFQDRSEISSWASKFVDQAAALGLINGRGNNSFQPKGGSSRAEAAQVVYNLIKK
ncbi:S-layer homology domain-containing protein [Paenibacillus barengoltzii]|uniref:S-layer homology domain-containing protein n=1 Tax=Paenibacillus barengoltzii TaxID=343517 RepID=UPI00387909A5